MTANRQLLDKDSIVVVASSLTEEGETDIIASNVEFVNMLFEEYLKPSEIATDAMRSYNVDYFLSEFENGGFSQFVYNTRWDQAIVGDIRDGLKAMGAKRYLKAFEKGAKLVDAVDQEKLEAYFGGDYFHEEGEEEPEELVDWDKVDEAINDAGEKEDIFELHSNWLKKHPRLVTVQDEEEMREVARRRGAALPDRDARIASAKANEPRYLKLVRALCKESGQELDRLTAISPNDEYEGESVRAYHFITDAGHHHMIEHDGDAIMFRGHSKDEVCRIKAPADPVLH